jgi:protease I
MRLSQRNVVVLVDEGFEDLEFWVPVMRLREEGARVTIAGREAGQTFHGKKGLQARSERAAADLNPAEFDAVVVPGGWAPDKLRRDEGVKRLVREMSEARKVVAMICHAGWVGISAGVVDGVRATGSEAIRDDLENAGAEWADEPAFRDGHFVWGRVVDDIPDFCRELVAAIEERASTEAQAATRNAW